MVQIVKFPGFNLPMVHGPRTEHYDPEVLLKGRPDYTYFYYLIRIKKQMVHYFTNYFTVLNSRSQRFISSVNPDVGLQTIF